MMKIVPICIRASEYYDDGSPRTAKPGSNYHDVSSACCAIRDGNYVDDIPRSVLPAHTSCDGTRAHSIIRVRNYHGNSAHSAILPRNYLYYDSTRSAVRLLTCHVDGMPLKK